MNIISQIKELKDFLLTEFDDKIISGQNITQSDLENAIRKQQGGLDQCGYSEAKILINLLWKYHPDELARIYRLVPQEGLSLEIQETIKEAHNYPTG